MHTRSTLLLASTALAPATARAHIRAHGAHWDDDVLDSALVATSELVTNAVIHGAGDVTLVLHVSDRTVRVEVQDHGDTPLTHLLASADSPHSDGTTRSPGTPGPALHEMHEMGTTAMAELLDEGGRGLPIVHVVASQWGVSQGPHEPGVTVWFELDHPTATSSTPR